MKIFINNYNLNKLIKKIDLLDTYFCGTKTNIEIISDDGIYYIDNNKFYKINIVSDSLNKLKNDTFELLLDKSVYNREIVHQIPLEHIASNITTFYYVINSKSKIKLVIEGKYELIEENNNNDKYKHFTPTDFYFEVPNEKNKFEILDNDDLNVFFSILN
jgi:hypothetical protein